MTAPGARDRAAPHRIAAIHYGAGTPVDELLREVAAKLAELGIRVGGLIQYVEVEDDGCCATVHLRDLGNGERISISQDLGPAATGCRLDPAALAEAAARLERSLDGNLQMLVLNRFGKAEAEGRGLRPVIQKAVAAGIPVLLAVKDEHASAWIAFHGGLAVVLPADLEAIVDWCRQALGPAKAAVAEAEVASLPP